MIVTILLWNLCSTIAWCFPDSVPEFPNPQIQFRACGRPKTSYVCDPEFILEMGEADKLDELAQELKTSTSCLCSNCADNSGVSIGIFVKTNVAEISESRVTGKEMAEVLRKEWKLGTCDDDIIIVLMTKSNTSDFSLGASVERVLPRQTAERIVNDCKIHFTSGYFYQGLESILNSFHDVIVKEQKKNVDSLNDLYLGLSVGFASLILLFICLLFIHVRQKRRRRRRCSNIYETDSSKNHRKNLPNDNEEQLESLNKTTDGNQGDA